VRLVFWSTRKTSMKPGALAIILSLKDIAASPRPEKRGGKGGTPGCSLGSACEGAREVWSQ